MHTIWRVGRKEAWASIAARFAVLSRPCPNSPEVESLRLVHLDRSFGCYFMHANSGLPQ